jgi:hypothetical protein
MTSADDLWVDPWVDAARLVHGDATAALELAARLGPEVPQPGSGQTRRRWRLLTEISAADLTAGRVAEAHLDALAILAEAGLGLDDPMLAALGVSRSSTWGVFAAEGPGVRVDAVQTLENGRWMLSGTKPWCSLAGSLSHALVTGHTADGRRLFAVDLRTPAVRSESSTWVARGLATVVSTPIVLDAAAAVPVGPDNWYLERPGFAWGGIGVAACWFGGLLGIARTMAAAARRREPDQIGLMHLGAVDLAVTRCRAALDLAAVEVDAGHAAGLAGAVLANRVRSIVAVAAEEVIGRAGHALGPQPLTQDEDHARRVADLTVYVRQHHAERDLAALGRAVLGEAADW